VTGPGGCAGNRLALGVYVLGAADSAERAVVRMHLARCRDCREELAGLAGLPGLLGRVPAAEAEKLLGGEAEPDSPAGPPPGSVLPRLLDRTVRARRSRSRRAAAAAAAAVVVAAAAGVAGQRALGAAPPAASQSSTHWETISARNDLTLARATVRYTPAAWGTEIRVRVGGIPAGTVCLLRVIGAGGREQTAAGWTIVAGHDTTWYPGSTSLAASGVRAFVLSAGGKNLITVPAS